MRAGIGLIAFESKSIAKINTLSKDAAIVLFAKIMEKRLHFAIKRAIIFLYANILEANGEN